MNHTPAAPALAVPQPSSAADALLGIDAVLDVLNDAVIAIDADWRIIRWNAGAEAIYGWTAAETLRRPISEVIPTLRYIDGGSREDAAARVMETGGWRGVVLQAHRDGSHRYIDASIRRLTAADGAFAGMVAVNRDITEQHHTAGHLAALATISLAFHAASGTVAEVLQTIMRAVATHMGDGGAIRLIDPDRQVLLPGVSYHAHPECQAFLAGMLADHPQRVDEGINAQVVRERTPLYIAYWPPEVIRARITPAYWPYVERFGVHSCIIAPLIARGQVIGTLTVVRDLTKISYSPADVRLLEELAQRAALVIERVRLSEAEIRTRRQLEALYAATRTFMEHLDQDAIFAAWCRYLQRGCAGAAVGIQLFNDQGMLDAMYQPPGQPSRLESIGNADLERLLTTGQPLVRQSPASDKEDGLGLGPAYQRWAALPILAREVCIGVLQITFSADGSGEDPLHYIQALTAQAAVAIEHARLLHHVRAGKDQLRRLAHQLVMVQERERAMLARELHDDIGQALTGLKLYVETTLLRPCLEWEDRLGTTRDLVIDALGRVRHLSLDIRPAALEDLGLLPALRWLLHRVAEHAGVVVTLTPHAELPPLPSDVELAIYRVVQEAVTNIVRHAGVTDAAVHLWATPASVSVLIQDRGRGFASQQPPTGLGLVSMRERMHILGGTLSIDAVPERGTSITIEVPLPAQEEGAYARDTRR